MKQVSKINKLFLVEMPTKAILELRNSRDRNNSIRAKKIGCDYRHYCQILKSFKGKGIIIAKQSEKDGRERFAHLTEKGKELADVLMSLNKQFTNIK